MLCVNSDKQENVQFLASKEHCCNVVNLYTGFYTNLIEYFKIISILWYSWWGNQLWCQHNPQCGAGGSWCTGCVCVFQKSQGSDRNSCEIGWWGMGRARSNGERFKCGVTVTSSHLLGWMAPVPARSAVEQGMGGGWLQEIPAECRNLPGTSSSC